MSAAQAVHREDGELVGFVSEDGGRWTAATVFGYPLSDHDAREDAEDALVSSGLSYLAERWLARSGDDWITVELVEASPSHVTAQVTDFGHPDRYGERFELPAPVTEGLRLQR